MNTNKCTHHISHEHLSTMGIPNTVQKTPLRWKVRLRKENEHMRKTIDERNQIK